MVTSMATIAGATGAAEKAREGVDREGAAHPRFVHMGGEDRIVGRMIDAVGQPQQDGASDQPGIAQVQAEHDQREAREAKAGQQDLARPDMVDDVAERRLGESRDDREHGQPPKPSSI